MITDRKDSVKNVANAYLTGSIEGAIDMKPLSSKRRGRPKKDPNSKPTTAKKTRQIYCSEGLYILALEKATEQGLSFSQYINNLILKDNLSQVKTKDDVMQPA